MDAKCGIMMCKLKGRMDKGGHYDVEMKGWMQKRGIIMCKLNGWMENDGHYDVHINGLMEKVAYDVQIIRRNG